MTEPNDPPVIDVHFNVPVGNGQHMNMAASAAYQLRDTLVAIIKQYEAAQNTPPAKIPRAKVPKKR